MYHVAVCDDNTAEGQHVLTMARQVLQERNIKADFTFFAAPEDLLAAFAAEHRSYDLLLLDMLYADTDGICLAQTLRDRGAQGAIIYTTTSRDYAIEGYKVQASDYLVKPIERSALAASIDRVLRRRDVLLVEQDGILRQVPISDIQHAEAFGNYVVLRTTRREEAARLRATLPEALQKLGTHRFARCHKGYLVHLGQVREVRANHILLQNGDTLPLGRQYRIELQKSILNYIEKAIPH